MKLFQKKIKNNKVIEIGKDTFIDPKAQIGNYTYIGRNCKISLSKIGRYCSIGDDVSIGPGEHDYNVISTSAHLYEGEDWYCDLTKKECTIGNDVWIGCNTVIRRGVCIGTGAVIGANSFVNKDVPEFAIVAGSPAKIIKYRFTPSKRIAILNSKYWETSPEEAKKIIAKLEKEYDKE